MSQLVAIGAAVIFGALAALHVFWAAGGKWGFTIAVPELAGARAFTPSRGATLAVAVALCAAAFVTVARGGLVVTGIPTSLIRIASFVLGGVFVLRAIGEFRLVGFFKRVRGSRFATYDTYVFSPLCLALGGAVLWLASGL